MNPEIKKIIETQIQELKNITTIKVLKYQEYVGLEQIILNYYALC